MYNDNQRCMYVIPGLFYPFTNQINIYNHAETNDKWSTGIY